LIIKLIQSTPTSYDSPRVLNVDISKAISK
jgi:hypothetical protein